MSGEATGQLVVVYGKKVIFTAAEDSNHQSKGKH